MAGTVSVYNLRDGRRLGRIQADGHRVDEIDAMTRVSALTFNESSGELLLGSRSGKVFIWSNES